MDKNKASATASSSTEKSGDKKDENFLTKTAHSIMGKVHVLTDDVKEKTHNLTHSSDAKTKKKDKDNKKTDNKSKTSSKTPTGANKDSGSDSGDEDDSPKQTNPPSVKRDNERGADKSGASGSKPPPPSPSSAGAAIEKKDTAPATSSRNTSDKPSSRDAANKSADDHKDAAPTAPASSSSSKPSNDNSATKVSGAPSNKTTDGGDATNKPSSGANSTDHIHISFDGVTTVDEVLDRIDQTIEKAKIVVEHGKGTIGLNIDRTTLAPVPTPADLEKKPIEKTEDDKNKKKEDNKEEPIHLNYNDIHTIEDILLKVNHQPGNRKVVFEHTSDDSGSITTQKKANPSTEVSSVEDDQIHVNIEGVQNLNDLLDRIDDAVQHIPVIIDTKSPGEKRQAPQVPNQNNDNNNQRSENTSAPNQNDNNNQPAVTPSAPIQKREAPKAPSSTNDQNNDNSPPNNKEEGNDKTPIIKVPEHEFESNVDNKQPTSSSSTSEKQKDEGGPKEWL